MLRVAVAAPSISPTLDSISPTSANHSRRSGPGAGDGTSKCKSKPLGPVDDEEGARMLRRHVLGAGVVGACGGVDWPAIVTGRCLWPFDRNSGFLKAAN
jgi:hypothetical protein